MVHLSDLDWQKPGEEAIKDYKKGEMVQGARARRRRREGAHLASASSSSTADPLETQVAGIKKGEVVTCTVTAVTDGGIEVQLAERPAGLHPQVRICRATAPNSAPTASPSAKRSTPRSPRLDRGGRKADAVDQGARDRRGEAGDGRIRLVGFAAPRLGDILGAAIRGRKGGDKDEKRRQVEPPPRAGRRSPPVLDGGGRIWHVFQYVNAGQGAKAGP